MRSSVLNRWCAAVGLIAAAACGSGDGGSEPGPPPSISLAINPASASAVQGGSAQTTATLTRGGGFTGAVSFSVDGAPAGVTGAVGDLQTSGGTTTATVTIQVGSAVAPGTYTLTVRATGTGVSAATATFQLTVTEAPSIALSLNPAGAISLEQGKTDNSRTVTITRVNYTGAVTLTAEGLPNGVTASFAGNPVTGTSALMTLTASAGATVGGPVTAAIRGTGPGTPVNLTATTAIQITVTAAPSFTLSLSPAAVSLPIGTLDNTRSVSITRTNFTAPITLSVEGLPNGVTAAFVANPVSGNFSLLALTAAPTAVATGPIAVTIRGTGPAPGGGAIEATTTITLTVDPAIFTMVAPGERHTCARATNNAIYCWGRNVFGQLGVGAGGPTQSLVPVKVTGGLSFKAVHTGGNHTCGITIDDRAFCWGAGAEGQLGNGAGTASPAPVEVFGQKWATLGLLEDASCGITMQGVTLCWGENDHGQLGDGSTQPKFAPNLVSGNHTFVSLGRFGGNADDHKCAIENNGSLWCWGDNQFGQIGDGTVGNDRLVPTIVAAGIRYDFSAQGDDASCAITSDLVVQCWGLNSTGRIGDGTVISKSTPISLGFSQNIVVIGVGETHVCAMSTSGDAFCWGSNANGRLGDGTTVDHLVPGAVSGGHEFTDVRIGEDHSCGVRRDGKILCWGSNQDGRLGDNSLSDRSVPTLIAPHPP